MQYCHNAIHLDFPNPHGDLDNGIIRRTTNIIIKTKLTESVYLVYRYPLVVLPVILDKDIYSLSPLYVKIHKGFR
jgi:hypothetical protein